MQTPTLTQMPEVGAMLRAMREGVGLSQSEMAVRAGTSKATLSRFEHGQRIISADLLARIINVVSDEVRTSMRKPAA